MKTLKYAIVSAILALGIAAPMVSAADDSAPPAKSKRGGSGYDMTTSMLKGITLTADQQKKVDAIKAAAQKQLQGVSAEERRTKSAEIRKDLVTQIRALLTDDQKKTFDENTKSTHGSKGGDSSKGKGGDKSSKKGGGKKPKASEGGDE